MVYKAGESVTLYVNEVLIESISLSNNVKATLSGSTIGAWKASDNHFVRHGAVTLRSFRLWNLARDGTDACLQGTRAEWRMTQEASCEEQERMPCIGLKETCKRHFTVAFGSQES